MENIKFNVYKVMVSENLEMDVITFDTHQNIIINDPQFYKPYLEKIKNWIEDGYYPEEILDKIAYDGNKFVIATTQPVDLFLNKGISVEKIY